MPSVRYKRTVQTVGVGTTVGAFPAAGMAAPNGGAGGLWFGDGGAETVTVRAAG